MGNLAIRAPPWCSFFIFMNILKGGMPMLVLIIGIAVAAVFLRDIIKDYV